MNKRTVVLTVVGARPQFIKAAPVSAALAASGHFREVLIHTGQHFDFAMSKVFFEELNMAPPAHNLDIHGGGHGDMTGRMVIALERIIQDEKPDWVLVYGDTNSTLAGSLTAAKLHIPIAHVESGLRSFRRAMPEEINRVLTDHLSDLLLCPTRLAEKNLAAEGIAKGVHVIGDVMYDAALDAKRRSSEHTDILARLELRAQQFAVATIHRAENVDSVQTLGPIVEYLRERGRQQTIILPLHPRTKDAVARFGLNLDPLRVCAPVSYLEMAALLTSCTAVYTDSGGLQKEAYFYGKPCVTLRDETEWMELVECGWNRLWRGPDFRARRPVEDYGNGNAAQKIVTLLR